MRLILAAVVLAAVACGTGGTQLQPGDCVDIVGTGSSAATERLITVDCESPPGADIFRVLWVEQAEDAEPLTVTLLAAECDGPTLLPDADMLAAGDRTVVCFEPLG